MCGRYSRSYTPRELAEFLSVVSPAQLALETSYNVAPTQLAPIIRLNAAGQRELVHAKWGLVPHWADNPSIGNRMINARCETIATSNAFRDAFARHRCIVPISGFYEWQKLDSKTKQPWYIHRADGAIMCLAGLWERWSKGPEPIDSFTIITTDCNDFVQQIHDRMPVILEQEDVARWLDSATPSDELQALLAPAADGVLTGHPVGMFVNKLSYNQPACIKPIENTEPGLLF